MYKKKRTKIAIKNVNLTLVLYTKCREKAPLFKGAVCEADWGF